MAPKGTLCRTGLLLARAVRGYAEGMIASSVRGGLASLASTPMPSFSAAIKQDVMITRGFAKSARGGSRSDSSSDDDWEEVPPFYAPFAASQVFVGQPAPAFTAPAVVDGEITNISLQDYKGKYVCLFFYPKDFTFVCPTEIIAFSDRAKEFEALNCQLIAASTDTEECHLAWIRTPRNRGGLGYMQIPILADTTKSIAARYGVLERKLGIALRGLFIINPKGIVQHITINDLPIGRSVDEALRTLQAIQYHAEHGEVCPANWKPGAKAMVADTEKSLEYFSEVKEDESPFGIKLKVISSPKQYQQLVAGKGPLVVDFYAPWCGKCRQIGPFLDTLVDKFPSVTFAKFDTTAAELESLAGELGVKALPAFRFFKDGKEVGAPVTGYKKKPLEEAVAALVA